MLVNCRVIKHSKTCLCKIISVKQVGFRWMSYSSRHMVCLFHSVIFWLVANSPGEAEAQCQVRVCGAGNLFLDTPL